MSMSKSKVYHREWKYYSFQDYWFLKIRKWLEALQNCYHDPIVIKGFTYLIMLGEYEKQLKHLKTVAFLRNFFVI